MVVGCILAGIIFGWFRLQSGCIWPAVFAHATFNTFATYRHLLVDERYDPLVAGPLSATGSIAVLAAIAINAPAERRYAPSPTWHEGLRSLSEARQLCKSIEHSSHMILTISIRTARFDEAALCKSHELQANPGLRLQPPTDVFPA